MRNRMRRGVAGLSPGRAILAVLAFGALLRVALVVLTPPLFAADEAGHLIYIHQVAIQHQFPIQTLDGRWANANGVEDFYHPPLYYLLMAPIYRIFWPSQAVLYAVRLVDAALGLCLVIVVYDFTRQHFGGIRWAAPVAGLLVAALPTMVGIGSSVNNDALSLLLIALVTAQICRPLVTGRLAARDVVTVTVLFSASLYTKNTALVLVPMLLLWGPVAFREDRRRWLLGLLPLTVGFVLILPWWVLRNQVTYGSLLAVDLNWGLRGGPFIGRLLTTVIYMGQTFWTGLGRSTEVALPNWIGVILSLTFYAAARHLARGRNKLTQAQRRAIILVLAPLPVAVFQAVYYGVTWGFGQGRYLYSAILGLAVLLAVGFTRSVTPRQGRARRALAWGVVPFWLIFIGVVVIPDYARVSVDRGVGGLSDIPSFRTGDLDTWVIHRTAPLRAEDACRSYTHSPFSPAC